MPRLAFLQRLAQKLLPLRLAFITLAALSLAIAIYGILVEGEFSNAILEPAIVGTLWGLLLFSFIQLFQTIPPPILPLDSLFVRLLARIKLFFYSLLAFVVILISILLVWMSMRLLLV